MYNSQCCTLSTFKMLYNHHHSSTEVIAFGEGPDSERLDSSSMMRKKPQLLKKLC